MLTRSEVELGGSRVSYLQNDRRGRTLLFIPGGVVDHVDLTWKTLIRRLATRYRILAPDLPGFGLSEGLPAEGYSTGFVLEFIRAFVNEMRLDQPILLVNSMSSAAALRFVLDRPDAVKGLVLSGAYGWQPSVPLHTLARHFVRWSKADAFMRWLVRIPGVVRTGLRGLVLKSESLTDELIQDGRDGAASHEAPTAFIEWLRDELQPHSIRSDLRARLKEISVPTLILQGAHDWLAPERYARAAAAMIPDVEYRVFETRHLIPRERLDEVEEVVERFVQRLVARAHTPIRTAG